MKKDRIKKHKKEIIWFIENPDKGVWRKTDNERWEWIEEPKFYTDKIYVINDKYAELRKKHIDGAEIECNCDGGIWSTEKNPSFYDHPDFKWREKSKEKFHKDDWVREIETGLIRKAKENIKDEDFEIWKPQKGELCVFSDSTFSEEYLIGRYNSTHESGTFSLNEETFEYNEVEWDRIEPLNKIIDLVK